MIGLLPRRPARRKQRGRAWLISLLLGAFTGYYFWSAGGKPELPFAFRSEGGVVAPAESWEVYFSPHGGATDAIVGEIARAKKRIRVQAYSFTSTPIAKALVTAQRRGIDVQVILDKSQRSERYTSATYLANSKVPVWIDAAHAIAHDKVIILDGGTVITGSFNFTNAAEKRNSENVLILRSAEIAAKYEGNWAHHAAHSQPFQGLATNAQEGSRRRSAR